ncbi:Hypothetical predicted protein [Mytilus galloprovincialis]|uniref:Reverse transcriptase domain-containing protein n=1 Tax=Mytilus galloprovincialis TaxID=29158 RepID=A0A8B6E3Q6_MYTGA|nr:Hypothetical predicted protein [Mytilus galloprovincialis]
METHQSYIEKITEEDSKELKKFRAISLLNIEGKVCLAILANRVTTCMLKNNYIDTAVQKGGAGYHKHTTVLINVIHEARENIGDMTALWLDLANAYGTQVYHTSL